MTGIKRSPRDEVKHSSTRKAPSPLTEKCHPLLQVLRMMLGEAYRYQMTTAPRATTEYHARSLKAVYYQLGYLWDELKGEPLEKYEFLRNRLALVLLWRDEAPNAANGMHSLSRCLMNPPTHMSSVFHMNRQRLLNTLKPGELFVKH